MALLRDWGLTLGRWTGRPVAQVQQDSGDPDVGRVREAAGAADWATVREVLEARPESEDRTELLWAVGDITGVEGWIAEVVEAEPEAPLPRLVAGIRHISWAWEARTAARAKDVSREQFEVFHDRLRTAERWLYEVAECEPQWTSPWYGLQITGRGLQVGQATARRRFEVTVRRDPHHLGAHQQQLQQICAKWGGGRTPSTWAGPRWRRPCARPPTTRSGSRTSSAGARGTRSSTPSPWRRPTPSGPPYRTARTPSADLAEAADMLDALRQDYLTRQEG